jgi:hypothetical protein
MEMPHLDMPKMDVDKELARMTQRYGLSESQKAQIRPVLVDVKAKMDALSKDSSTEFGERIQKMRAIREEQALRISAILSGWPTSARSWRWRTASSARELSIGSSSEYAD